MFEMPLGTSKWGYWLLKDAIMAVFWVLSFIGLFWPVFAGLWEPLGCLECLWTAIAAPFVTFGGPLGRLRGVLGLHLSPPGVHLDAFGRHWNSIVDSTFHFFENLTRLKTFVILLDYFRRKNTTRNVPIVSWTHYLWVQMDYSKKMQHRVCMHICESKWSLHKFVYQTFVMKHQFLRCQTVPRKTILK